MKIYDCLTFFNENFLVNARFEILNDYVDYFVICESQFDHSGKKKKLNFKLKNKKFENKIRYLTIKEEFPDHTDRWSSESFQREKIFNGISDASDDDLIMYSDSDEIPNPKILKNINFTYKYGIFFQKSFTYKLNIFNPYESPWEGTRICKKKFLKSFTHLRKKIISKNLKKSLWKIYYEKNIQIYKNGGWHFNNLYSPNLISKKLRVFPHSEFSTREFTNLKRIKSKINNLEDLFNRNHKYKKIRIDKTYPKFFLKNINKIKNYII